MVPRANYREVCELFDKRIAIGGQDPTSPPEIYAAADYLVLDEGEITVPMFLADLGAGATRGTYRTTEARLAAPELHEPIPSR